MENGRNKACTTVFFLIPKNVTSERPIALMPILIRWWEVAKWQQKYRVDRDATDSRNGGAQQTVWEMLLEMERFRYRARERRFGSSGLGLGSGEGLRAGQSSCGVCLGDALQFPTEDLAGVGRKIRAPKASTF